MLVEKDLRIDKWLWAVRIFKTRSQATAACRKGRVIIGHLPVKPSRIIKINDVVVVKRPPVNYSYRVKGLLGKRLSARRILEYVENITPAEELQKLAQRDTFFIKRDRGSGRPTKKERRIIDHLTGRTS